MPVWSVLDFKVVPPLQKGETLAYTSCQLSGTPQPDAGLVTIIMAQGHENDPSWKGVRMAWRLNPKTGRIEEVPAAHVTCQNEALGV